MIRISWKQEKLRVSTACSVVCSQKYPETRRGRGVVSVHCAAEAKKQYYQQTEKEIDAVKSEL
jgi:hypothetical protein